MEASHRDRNPPGERPRNVEGTWILVRLDTDQGNETEITMVPEPSQKGRDIDPADHLIEIGLDINKSGPRSLCARRGTQQCHKWSRALEFDGDVPSRRIT